MARNKVQVLGAEFGGLTARHGYVALPSAGPPDPRRAPNAPNAPGAW